MNILLFGRGFISTLYGWAFEKAGHTTTFYVRPRRSAECGSRLHLDIFDLRRGPQQKHVDEDWKVRMVEELPADHSYDLILVSVQHWQFAEVAKFLESRTGRATLLIFNNFWCDLKNQRDDDRKTDWLGPFLLEEKPSIQVSCGSHSTLQ